MSRASLEAIAGTADTRTLYLGITLRKRSGRLLRLWRKRAQQATESGNSRVGESGIGIYLRWTG